MKRKLLLFFLSTLTLVSCNKQEIVRVFINSNEITLTHQAYKTNDVVFADAVEFSPYLGAIAETPDNKGCIVTKNNIMIFFHVDNNYATVSNLNTSEDTTRYLRKNPKTTSYGVDIPVQDLGEILGYTVSLDGKNLTISKSN